MDSTLLNRLGTALIMATGILVTSLNIVIYLKLNRKSKRKITASAHYENIYQELQALLYSISSQRHDFVNHVQVMRALIRNGNHFELQNYLDQLAADITITNNLIKTDNPVIAALFNSKLNQARTLGAELEIDLEADLASLSVRAFTLARILGNLLDNALEAVAFSDSQDKSVRVIIRENGPFLLFSIINSGSPNPEKLEHLFQPGYSSKGEPHSGLGLYICQHLARQLHGKIEYSLTSDDQACFLLIIPK